jgi:hypothetical protein
MLTEKRRVIGLFGQPRLCSNELNMQIRKQIKFTAEIAIHFPGLEGLKKPIVWVFPEVVICSHCGKAQFVVPETQLRLLVTEKATGTE